jgi:hypothetical protein
MKNLITAVAIAALSLGMSSIATIATAQKLDANGKCHAADGKMAKMEVCKTAKPAATAGAKCRDKTTKKFAKCDAPNTEPLPEKKK